MCSKNPKKKLIQTTYGIFLYFSRFLIAPEGLMTFYRLDLLLPLERLAILARRHRDLCVRVIGTGSEHGSEFSEHQ